MALDTITIHFLTEELKDTLTDARIEKVHQPEKDEILLILKTYTNTYRLVISANASQPRIHFTQVQKENPKTAPMFCMLLRKHLQSGRIVSINQIDFERIIRIDVDSYDEFGDLTRKYLFCEMMGRHSNIILTREDLSVIDSVKHVDITVSSVRQILPGLTYCPPPAQDKIPVLSDNVKDAAFDFTSEGQKPDKEIMARLSGISPLLAREAVFCAVSEINIDCSALSNEDRQKITQEAKRISKHKLNPCIITDKASGRVIDYSPFDIIQYGDTAEKRYYKSLNDLLDDFYRVRDNTERMKQKSADTVHILHTAIDRTAKKIAILQKTLDDAKRKEEYKIYGDLLTANIYKFSQGDKDVTVENYYSPDLEQIKISLSPQLSPSQNAQRYYKLYRKAENAEKEAAKQLETATADLEYLESALVLVQNAQSEKDINAIRSELSETGYIRLKSQRKAKRGVSKATSLYKQ